MDLNGARVLIVDDDRDIGLLLSALMAKERLASQVAHDGETALRLVPKAARICYWWTSRCPASTAWRS